MTKEEVFALAREAGLKLFNEGWTSSDNGDAVAEENLERFAALVAKTERHRICEMLRERHKQEERHNYYGFIANMIEEMP